MNAVFVPVVFCLAALFADLIQHALHCLLLVRVGGNVFSLSHFLVVMSAVEIILAADNDAAQMF